MTELRWELETVENDKQVSISSDSNIKLTDIDSINLLRVYLGRSVVNFKNNEEINIKCKAAKQFAINSAGVKKFLGLVLKFYVVSGKCSFIIDDTIPSVVSLWPGEELNTIQRKLGLKIFSISTKHYLKINLNENNITSIKKVKKL